VDIKVSNDLIYVIEVNDNPNIDNQTEDRVLKDELYRTVIRSLLTRIENARGQKRNVS
jgi:glutathione synthase/RimK-type ligase-like ATP-grasp enzyme